MHSFTQWPGSFLRYTTDLLVLLNVIVFCFFGACFGLLQYKEVKDMISEKYAFNRSGKNNSSLSNTAELCVYIWVAGTPKFFLKKVKKESWYWNFFLHDYIKINLAMDNKDGNFNSSARRLTGSWRCLW